LKPIANLMKSGDSTTTLSVRRSDPSERLRPFVHCYLQRDARVDGVVTVEPVMARLEQAFEFQFGDPYEVRLYGSEARDPCPPVIVVGPQTRRRARLILHGTVSAFAVMLRPGGLHRLFGLPLHRFADCGTDAHSLLGHEVTQLRERLGNTDTFAKRVRLIEQFLSQTLLRAAAADRFAGTVAIMLRRAQAREGDPWARTRIAEMAFQTGLSTRQFQRRFREYTGVAPIVFSRIARFEEALRLKRSPRFASWTEIAHTLGYHDQMHMTRDFHGLAGDSPGRAIVQVSPEHIMSALTQAEP
jgi:AraC-like DNA-binding protein